MQHPRQVFRTTLAAAAVAAALPLTNVAHAQELESASCDRLLVLVDEAGDDNLAPDFVDARTVAMNDDAGQCSLYVARVVQVGGIAVDANAQTAADTDMEADTDTDTAAETETETATETVQVQQEATIEGEVQVTLPDPQVDIEQSPAEVTVRDAAPEVSVDQARPTIVVRQAAPRIRVQMPQPTITIEQPAPEIVVTMPDPSVNVASAQPQVEVNVPEPRVTVTQGEPMLNVDLSADMSAERDPNLERVDNEDGSMVVTRTGASSAELAPRIQYVQSEQQAQVSINRAEADVQYVAADPQVEFEQGGEPQIELISTGEPSVVFEGGEDEGASLEAPAEGADAAQVAAVQPLSGEAVETEAEEPAATALPGQRDPREAFAADPSDVAYDGSPSSAVRVADLDGMEVINGRGENLGEVERVVRNGPDAYLIMEHGGWFFGLNDKEVAFPLGNVMVREDQVVLRGMTEEQIEQMPDYDFANETNLGAGDEVEVMRVQ